MVCKILSFHLQHCMATLNVSVEGKTRLGPTALATPRLENSKHFFDVLSPDLLKLDLHLDVMKVT